MPRPRASLPIALLALLALWFAGCRVGHSAAGAKASHLQTCTASQDPASGFCAID
jgi:hypothetical protein